MSDRFSSHQQPSGRRILIDVVRGIAIDVVPVRLSCTPGVLTFGGNFYVKVPVNPNLRIKTLKRGGAKVFFRFHGGIGGGIASQNTITNHSPLKLFDALKPITFQNGMMKMIMEWVPVIGPPAPPVQASSGSTGVMYSKRELRFGTFDPVYKNGD